MILFVSKKTYKKIVNYRKKFCLLYIFLIFMWMTLRQTYGITCFSKELPSSHPMGGHS